MMSSLNRLLLQVFFLVVLPGLGGLLIFKFGLVGLFIYLFVGVLWCWEAYVFTHYRYCRREEFLSVLRTAATTQMPMEAMLRAYLDDRPRDHRAWVYVALFFVFPGYFLIHRSRSFDSQLLLVLALLDHGVPLSQALRFVPRVVSRQTALAVTVGQCTGQLPQALGQIPTPRSPWLELAPRLIYPLLVIAVLCANAAFLTVFITPKFEKIFADFHMRLPALSSSLILSGKTISDHAWIIPNLLALLVILINLLIFDSRAKWHAPLLGRVYRMHTRGQFLQTLGLMMDSGKPLPEILGVVNQTGILPRVIEERSRRLALEISHGAPLAETLAKCGLATPSASGLIASAERAGNLPWALRELGAAMMRRAARITYRLAMLLFPLAVFACAGLVALLAVAMFSPLTGLLRGMTGG